jgi:5-hydroxyisourate hydrolase-like protein (transthyretin family)
MTVEAPGVVDVELPPAGMLRGRVVEAATGAPVPEFTFSVEPMNPEPGARHQGGVHRGEQSPDGTFTVSVPVGAYRVSAGAPGFTAAEAAEVRVSDREPALVELRLGRGVTVTGRVTDESGTPLADADVMVMGPEHGPSRTRRMARVGPGHAKTDADGTFRITGVEPGEAHVHVRMTGYVTFRKTINAEGTTDLDVRLARGLSLRGVVTRNGKPLQGVQVSASTPAIGGEHQPAITDADGRFTLTGLVAARYTVSAYFEEQHASVNNVDPAKQKELTIALDAKPRGVIYGTVSGIPTNAGKVVRRAVSVESENGSAEGVIDDGGNYRIENAPVGVVYVAADVESAPRGARSILRKQVEIVAGQALRVDFDLGGNIRVSGRVTHEGKPLAGVHVGFASQEQAMINAVTREDGTYEAALPAAGRYAIYARAEQLFDRHYQSVRDVRGGERIDIDLREQVLEGMVVDAVTRQPIANAIVTLTPLGSGMPSALAEVPTDANGRFRITAASAGAHRLVATATGYAQRAIPTNTSATQYAFELTPVADLRVRVVDVSSRAPLDAHLIIEEMDGSYVPVRARRTSDGTVYVFSLAPGKYRIVAVVQGYQRRVVDVTAPGTVDVVME